jgi:hypothetical protein
MFRRAASMTPMRTPKKLTLLGRRPGPAVTRMAKYLTAIALACWAWNAAAQSDKQTTIHIKEDEKHDRLTPDFEPDIEWLHELTVTLSGNNVVHESGNRTFLGSPRHPTSSLLQERFKNEFNRDVALGQDGGKVVWRVLGPNKLRRIWQGQQVISIFDISIDRDRNCHISRKVLLQKGFTFSIGLRAGTNTYEHFSAGRLVSITCSIE